MARRKVVKIQAKNKSGYTEDDNRVREQVIIIRRLLVIISDLFIEKKSAVLEFGLSFLF